MLGSIRIFGVGLGIAGVVFAGIAWGHFGITLNKPVLEFMRDFGLALYVYAIGMQVGPSFFASLRRQGLPLNLMAVSVVAVGVAITVLVKVVGHVPMPIAVGLLSGSVTNTPSLAAAQQTMSDIPHLAGLARLVGLGYAIGFPFGIVGIILSMPLIRLIFRINVRGEVEQITRRQKCQAPALETMNLEVRNPELAGMSESMLPRMAASDVVISRIMHDGGVAVAGPETMIQQGDVLLGVGTPANLHRLEAVVGRRSSVNLKEFRSRLHTRRIMVTRDAVLGKTLDELGICSNPDITLTRVRRMDLEFTARPNFRIEFADSVFAVGENWALDDLATMLGDSRDQAEFPRMLPIFIGLAVGVLAGSIPISIPGVPAGVKMGMAGGPLIISLILSRIGRIGPLVFYVPKGANTMLREVGVIIFLACAGLYAGNGLFETLQQGNGLQWVAVAILIAMAPLLLVAVVARLFWKVNYATLAGVLAGSMTIPPALVLSGSLSDSPEVPSMAYATVYPLVMLLRVLSSQALVLFLAH
jgi:putative transport protein